MEDHSKILGSNDWIGNKMTQVVELELLRHEKF